MVDSQTITVEEKMTAHMYFERGNDYMAHGDFWAAKRDFEEALKSNPKPELEKKCREAIERLGTDKVEVTVGLLVLAVVLGLFVTFGLLR